MKNFIQKGLIVIISLLIGGVLGNRAAHADPTDANYAKKTFSAQILNFTPAATATDAVLLTGSASKIVRVTGIRITGVATAASALDFYLYKRTAADTAGTSANVIPVQHDAIYPNYPTITNTPFVIGNSYQIVASPVSTACNSIGAASNTAGTNFVATGASATPCSAAVAASSQAKTYSVNPTALGYGLLLRADHYSLAAAATAATLQPWAVAFGQNNEQAPVLRGINDSFALNLNGQTIPAGTILDISITWTED